MEIPVQLAKNTFSVLTEAFTKRIHMCVCEYLYAHEEESGELRTFK